MLVLSRKPGETLVIGERIKVSVLKLDGNKVRLGVEAPENIRILRGELKEWLEAPAKSAKRARPQGNWRANQPNERKVGRKECSSLEGDRR